MSENDKAIRSLAQKAAVDTKVFRALLNDPVATVKKKSPELSDDEAKEFAHKTLEVITTRPDIPIVGVFQQMISNATDAFRKTVFLNQVLFWAGIVLLAACFGFEIAGRVTGNDTWQNVATTGIIGAIGISTLISSFILRPLTAIQNSVGNLAQIEVAVLSFIERRRIIINMEPQNINEANQLSVELGTVVSQTMQLIQTYCEEHPDKPEASQSQTPPAGAALPKAPS